MMTKKSCQFTSPSSSSLSSVGSDSASLPDQGDDHGDDANGDADAGDDEYDDDAVLKFCIIRQIYSPPYLHHALW